MKVLPERNRPGISIPRALLAGLAGGIAEVLWVSAWAAATPLQFSTVGREITRTVYPSIATAPTAAEIGLIIHLAISLSLGLIFVLTLGRHLVRYFGGAGVLAGSITLLALIWVINFLVVLPVLNPVFATLMPTAVTLGSKTLFGIVMGVVLIAGPQTFQLARKLRASG